MTEEPDNCEQKNVERVTVNSRIQKMLDDFWKEKVVAEYRDNANIAHYVQNRKDTRLIMEQWSTEMLSLYRFIGYTSFIGILANVIHGKILHENVDLISASVTCFLVTIAVLFLGNLCSLISADKIIEARLNNKSYEASNVVATFSCVASAIFYLVGLCLLIHSFIGV